MHRPILYQRYLRTELRRLREELQKTQHDVAASLYWSVSKILRIENGASNISVTDLSALLKLYDVTDAVLVAEYTQAAILSRRKEWWTPFKSSIGSEWCTFIAHEDAAARIRHYHPLTIPDLLQTSSYSSAVAEAYRLDHKATRIVLDMNANRRRLLDPGGPQAQFILDEAAVLRQVDGPHGMREQWRHILERAEQDDISIRVLPITAGAHLGMRGPFTVLDLLVPDRESLLVLGHPLHGAMIHDDHTASQTYVDEFERLHGLALDDDESGAFIRELIDSRSR